MLFFPDHHFLLLHVLNLKSRKEILPNLDVSPFAARGEHWVQSLPWGCDFDSFHLSLNLEELEVQTLTSEFL